MNKAALAIAAALLFAGTAQAALVTVDYAVPIAAIAGHATNPFRLRTHGNGDNAYLSGGAMSFSVSAVPESATGALALAGLAIVAAAARRRKAVPARQPA